MSNTESVAQTAQCQEHPCAGIELIISPRPRDIGGFSVRRLLPVAQRRMVGPWIFFDHMGPAAFEPGAGIAVRPHPHINLATVTFLFEGEILHRDSLGSEQVIRPGDINLMVAGRGIVHSEREAPEVRNRQHRLHGLQLWLALPVQDEEVPPAFFHHPARDLPVVEVGGVPVRVMMGSAYGVTSPVQTFARTLYLEVALKQGQALQVPPLAERAVYSVQGTVAVNGTAVAANSMAVLMPNCAVTLTTSQTARVILVGGESLGPRFIEWNFVSSRKARIEEAKADWQAGRFPKVPGDDIEYIPLPSQ